MIEFEAEYYDGTSSKGYSVSVIADDTFLKLIHQDFRVEISLSEITLDPIVGSARSIIRFNNGAELHCNNTYAIHRLEPFLNRSLPDNFARFLENRTIYAISALIFTALFIFALLRWGIPSAATFATHSIPQSAEHTLSKQSLELLDTLYLKPTKLDKSHQLKLTQRLKELCTKTQCPPHTLLFRNSPTIGANAFALPANQMVITDQLIEKAHNDEEILAVLSHELGHIQNRHILRMMLQSIGSGVIIVMITGELSDYSDLAAGIPAILLQQGYSREMEDEADLFALQTLKKAHIPTHRFADILERISPQDVNSTTTLFSSHPDTKERIKRFL